MRARTKYSASILLLACLPLVAVGQSSCKAPSADCVAVGEWDLSLSFGYGERSNPITGNSDIPLYAVPHISYYGKRFFLENLELGYTLYENDSHIFNLIATPGYDRVFFVRDDPQNYLVSGFGSAPVGAPAAPEIEEAASAPRRTTYLTGVEWLFSAGSVTGQLDALYEATGRHKGYEVRAAIAAPILQTEDSLVVNTGFTWKSAALVDYYYGVDGRYDAAAALTPFIKLGYSRQLAERWTVNAFVHYEHLGDAIADSPIVTDDGVLTVFAGVVFKIF